MQPSLAGPQLPARAADPGGRTKEGSPSCFSRQSNGNPRRCAATTTATISVATPLAAVVTTAAANSAPPAGGTQSRGWGGQGTGRAAAASGVRGPGDLGSGGPGPMVTPPPHRGGALT